MKEIFGMTLYNIVSNIMTVICGAFFLCIFFFTYGKRVEKQIFINNTTYLINELFDTILFVVPAPLKDYIHNMVSTINIDNSLIAAIDNKIEDYNSTLKKKTIAIFTILFIVCMIILICIAIDFNLNIKLLLIENFIILCGIALIEYGFLTFYISKCIAADPNKIIYNVIKMFNPKV